MNNPYSLDAILPSSDHRRLERLAQVGADDVHARFLLNEINRAEVGPDRAARLHGFVTMGSWGSSGSPGTSHARQPPKTTCPSELKSP